MSDFRKIKDILDNNPSIEQLIKGFEQVKKNGDIALIKLDGTRTEKWYTILITFPDNKREMIRNDDDDLKTALETALRKYIQ